MKGGACGGGEKEGCEGRNERKMDGEKKKLRKKMGERRRQKGKS
jgi:hypothetical protein